MVKQVTSSVLRLVLLSIAVIFLLCFVIRTGLEWRNKAYFRTPDTRVEWQPELENTDLAGDKRLKYINWFKFVPIHRFTECTELFSNSTEAANFQLSAEFNSEIKAFQDTLNSAVQVTGEEVEGHSFQYSKYFLTLHYLAKELDFVKTVCETGFNAGHSAFNFLSAKQSITLHSFDIGRWKYTGLMAEFLKSKYTERFHIYLGDSTVTLPVFISNNSATVSCDLLHVDGGHFDVVPLKDLENFSQLANLENNIVFVDNANMNDVGRAWNKLVQLGVIRPLMRCKLHEPSADEMAIGSFVKQHH